MQIDPDDCAWRREDLRAVDTHIDVKTGDHNLSAHIRLDGTGRDNIKIWENGLHQPIALWNSEAPTFFREKL